MSENIYKIMRTRKMLPIPVVWNIRSQSQLKTEKVHGVRTVHHWQHNRNGELTVFYIGKEWDEIGEFLSKRMQKDEDYIPNIYKQQKKEGHALVELSHTLKSSKLHDRSLEELFGLYQHLEDAWVEFDHLNVPPWFIGADYFQAFVRNELSVTYKLTEDDMVTLLTPAVPSFSAQEELDMYELALTSINDKEDFENPSVQLREKIEVLVEKYYWIPFGYDGPITYTYDHYIQALKDIVHKKTSQEIEQKIFQIKNYESDLKNKHEVIYKKYSLPKNVERWITVIHTLTFMTDDRKEYAFQAHEAFYRILTSIAEKIGVQTKLLKYVLLNEIKEFVNNPEKLTELAEKRMNGLLVITWQDEKYVVLDDEEALNLEKLAIPKVGLVTEIKGQIGCRGRQSKTVGIVRLLPSSLEINKLVEGEILVTSMTSPEFVPAMRKSLAIITDEGGITCHAAIVSRELNISCIIGTRIATKVLKDGDKVEVDTEKGMIKILK